MVADAAWRDEGYDGGHFGRWRSCSRTCASNFCDSSRALEIPEGGGGRTYDGDKGDVALMVSPWEWRRDGNAMLERERALSRKEGEDASPGPGEEDGGVTKPSDISRRGIGTESFSL